MQKPQLFAVFAFDECFFQQQVLSMRSFSSPVTFSEISERLKQGCKVSLFIRHSERPPISPDDKAFGKTLPLTSKGETMAREAGRLLAGFTDVRFAASPMVRCQLTARYIGEGMGIPDPVVVDEERLGLRCFYYENPAKVQSVMRERGYIAYMLDYLREGRAPYSVPLSEATPKLTEWLKASTVRSLNILLTHDIFVAAYLTGLKIRTYTADDWVGFIHGAALIHTPENEWLCGPCVPRREQTEPSSFVH